MANVNFGGRTGTRDPYGRFSSPYGKAEPNVVASAPAPKQPKPAPAVNPADALPDWLQQVRLYLRYTWTTATVAEVLPALAEFAAYLKPDSPGRTNFVYYLQSYYPSNAITNFRQWVTIQERMKVAQAMLTEESGKPLDAAIVREFFTVPIGLNAGNADTGNRPPAIFQSLDFDKFAMIAHCCGTMHRRNYSQYWNKHSGIRPTKEYRDDDGDMTIDNLTFYQRIWWDTKPIEASEHDVNLTVEDASGMKLYMKWVDE